MAVVAILSVGLAVFQGFYYEKRGKLFIHLDPPTRVFDLHQSIGGLEVSYGGEDLRKSNKTLWIISVSIKNTGNAEIRKGDYDEQAPVGLTIDEGQIVDTPKLRTSVNYLQQNLKIKTDNQKLVISPVIFEPDDTIHVTFLVLGSDSKQPKIYAIGKIAGIQSIGINTENDLKSDDSLMQRIIGADAIWIQPIRMFVYGFGGLLGITFIIGFLLMLISPFETIRVRGAMTKRRSIIDTYRQDDDLSKEHRLLCDLYIRDGEDVLPSINRIIKRVKNRIILADRLVTVLDESEIKMMLSLVLPFRFEDRDTLDELITRRAIDLSSAKPIISDNLDQALLNLCTHLEIDLESDKYKNSKLISINKAKNRTEITSKIKSITLGSEDKEVI